MTITPEEVSTSNAQPLVEVSRGCIAKPLRCSQARPWHQMSAAYLPGERTPDFLTVYLQAQTPWAGRADIPSSSLDLVPRFR